MNDQLMDTSIEKRLGCEDAVMPKGANPGVMQGLVAESEHTDDPSTDAGKEQVLSTTEIEYTNEPIKGMVTTAQDVALQGLQAAYDKTREILPVRKSLLWVVRRTLGPLT